MSAPSTPASPVRTKLVVERLSHAFSNIGEMLKFAGLIKRVPPFEEIVDTRYAPTRFP